MTSVISTQSTLARPSAVISRTMSDLERVALGQGSIVLCLDPREIAQEYSRLTLRDRIGARPCQFNGGTMGDMNGNPAINMTGVNDVAGRVNFTLPTGGYFIGAVVNLRNLDDTTDAIIQHVDNAANRLLFAVMNNRSLRLDHGTSAVVGTGVNAVTANEPHVLWASYDPVSGRAHIGIDAVTEIAQGDMAAAPKSEQDFYVFGGLGVQAVDGLCGPLIVGNQFLGGERNYAQREAILAWLAQYGGVAMAT